MTKLRWTAVPALMLLAAGCDEAGPTGLAAGESRAEVRVHGDAPAADPAESQGTSPEESSRGESDVEGSVEVRARVYLQSEAGTWVELTQGAASRTVSASGEHESRMLASSELEARSYQRVRVEFEEVRAALTGGIGVELGSSGLVLTVNAGADGTIVVEREVALHAGAGDVSRIDIDLNISRWAGESGSGGVVAESAFTSAVAITTR